MRAIFGFFAVTGIFVGINAIAAGVLFVLFKGLQAAGLEQYAVLRIAAGIAGVAFSIWVSAGIYRLIDRGLARRRVRARA